MSMGKYLTPEGKAEYNAYMREYRRNHKDQLKEIRRENKEALDKNQANYWNRKAAARESAEV